MAIIRPGSFSFPRQWSRQVAPNFPVEIDAANSPPGLYLSVLLNGSSTRDLAGARLPVVTGAPPFTQTGRGVAMAGGTGIALGYSFAAAPTTYSMEVLVVANPALTAASYICGFNQNADGTSGAYDRNLSGTGANQYAASLYDGATKSATEVALDYYNSITTHIVGTSDGTTLRLYINGALAGSVAAGFGYAAYANPVYFVIGNGGAGGVFQGKILLANLSNAVWSDGVVAARAAAPFAMFRPVVRRSYFVAAAGGGVYSASISETAATSDAFLSSAIFASTISDAGASSDQFTSSASFFSALTDSASSSDTFTATVVFLASLADAAASSDTLTAAGAFPATLADSAASSDALSGAAIFQASLADVSVTSDLLTTLGIFGASYGDIAASSDLFSGAGVFLASLSDVAVVSDAFTIPAAAGLIGYPTPSGRILGLQPASRSSQVTASSRSAAVLTSPRQTK